MAVRSLFCVHSSASNQKHVQKARAAKTRKCAILSGLRPGSGGTGNVENDESRKMPSAITGAPVLKRSCQDFLRKLLSHEDCVQVVFIGPGSAGPVLRVDDGCIRVLCQAGCLGGINALDKDNAMP